MPNALNRLTNQQWQCCDRCQFLFPMSQLVKQKGLMICTKYCFDNLEVERRPIHIMQILGTGVEQEGVDTRVVDRGFFEGFDETDR